MNSNPLVSVVIPAFNAEQWIAETIASVLSQEWDHLEVIIVDDESVDKTLSIAREFADDRVVVIGSGHAGAAAARNTGLRGAGGDLIQFLDADDVISRNKLSSQISALLDAPPRSIASCSWASFSGATDSARVHAEPVWTEEDPVDWLRRSLAGEGMMQPAGWLVPRDVVDAAGPWNERLSLHDDGDYFARILVNASRNVFVSEAIVYYRTVPESLSRRRSREAMESALAVCRGRHRALLAARDDSATRQAVATQYAQFAYEFAASAPDLAGQAINEIRELGARPVNAIGGRQFRSSVRILGMEKALMLRSRLAGE